MTPSLRTYHILLGTPPQNMIDLREDAVRGDTIWTINSLARRGDTALFYMKSPLQRIVGRGVVLRDAYREQDAQSSWYNYHMADIGELELFERPITRREIREEIPGWRYFMQPHRSSRVPEPFVPDLERLLRRAFT